MSRHWHSTDEINDLSAYQLDQTLKTGSIQNFFHNQEMVFVGFQPPLKQWVKKTSPPLLFSKGFNHRNWVNHYGFNHYLRVSTIIGSSIPLGYLEGGGSPGVSSQPPITNQPTSCVLFEAQIRPGAANGS